MSWWRSSKSQGYVRCHGGDVRCHGGDVRCHGGEVRDDRRAYAAAHGYDLHFSKDTAEIAAGLVGGTNLSSSNAPAFWRAHAVQRVLDGVLQYDWLFWLDCGVIVPDTARPVEALLAIHGVDA